MISIEIQNVKDFMNTLLTTEAFDSFYLEEATIITFNTFIIDGHTVTNYYEGIDTNGEEMNRPGPYSTWKQMRPILLSLIKGRRSPVSMRLTLLAGENYLSRLKSRQEAASASDAIKALAVNIRFEGSTLTCTTGTSYHTFVMDKTIDNIWDSDFLSSLTTLGIRFDIR